MTWSAATAPTTTRTTGFTLPTTGTVAGTYQWDVTYNGDADNNAVPVDQGNPAAEQVTVNLASPTLLTTANSDQRSRWARTWLRPFLTDTAVLSGGYNPTDTIVFTLTGPDGFTYTQTDTVNGDGTYTASTTLPTTGTVAGTYTWSVTYAGDVNNNAAMDQGGTAEQTVVSPASPTLVTTASRWHVTLPTGPPGTVTLSDSAVLSGSYFPTGTLVFTLTGPGGFSFTDDVTVNGNNTYTASSTPLSTTGTAAGTYTWSVTYGGNVNNNAAMDQGGPAEQTVRVSPASPTIVTTASSAERDAGHDRASGDGDAERHGRAAAGGYFPTGNLVFTLKPARRSFSVFTCRPTRSAATAPTRRQHHAARDHGDGGRATLYLDGHLRRRRQQPHRHRVGQEA